MICTYKPMKKAMREMLDGERKRYKSGHWEMHRTGDEIRYRVTVGYDGVLVAVYEHTVIDRQEGREEVAFMDATGACAEHPHVCLALNALGDVTGDGHCFVIRHRNIVRSD